VQIVPFDSALATAFADLNRAWIEQLFTLEPADLKVLSNPQASIIDAGGQILFALDGGIPVGTVAAILTAPRRYELAKMAVATSHQGQGVGFTLGEAVIEWARSQEAESIFLLTNSSLAGAIRLYRRLGFVHRPLPGHTEYARADVYMEIIFPLV